MRYQLRGVVCHCGEEAGSLQDGHYYAKTLHTTMRRGASWWWANDGDVRPCVFDDVQSDVAAASLLFYVLAGAG